MNRQNQNRRVLLLFALVFGVTGVAQADPALRVRGIRVSEADGDTSIAIQSSGKPTFTTWKLEQPARVVVEVSGARLGDVDVPMDVGTRAVGTVSANVTDDSTAGPRTRIVLTLRQPSDYRVEAKGNDILLKVVPHQRLAVVKPATSDRDPAVGSLKNKVSEQEKAIAEAKAESAEKERVARAQIERETRARSEAQSQTQKAYEEKVEAERRALQASRAKSEAEALAQAAAKAKAEAVANAEAATKAKDEAEAQVRAATKAKAEAEAQARIAAKEKQEAESKVKEALAAKNAALARAEAEAEARRVAERAALENAKRVNQVAVDVKSESEAKQRAQKREAESHQSAEQAKVETEHLRKALAEAQRETERARALAEKAREEKSQEQRSREQSEASLRVARMEAETARQRADRAEGEVQAMRRRESEQAETLRIAMAEVDARKKALANVAKLQKEQDSNLAESQKRLARREMDLKAHLADLSAKDAAAREARSKRDALAEGASEKMRQRAADLVAKAEEKQASARAAADQSRRERDLAVQARLDEEKKRTEQARLRQQEERGLAEAIAQRKLEEARLLESKAERQRLEVERAKLLAEKASLEKAKATLAKEVERRAPSRAVAETPPPREVAPVAAPPAPTLAPVVTPSAMASASPQPARSRSITIRGRSVIRSVNFVDEPQRSSVIIDVDESAEFKLERLSGKQISLRIDHADLPSELERNLDATEYLGPVKVVSSFRDPNLRGTVRIVVDLAEDVPNRVRQDGRRIFWDFQKQSAKAPASLPAHILTPPTARSVPLPKFAGVLVAVTPAMWQAQAGGAPAPARPSLVGKKRYVGRRIDLDFKGADIHNILRLLADVGGVNIVVADEVRGDVTIKMRDVPWDQALDVVLRAKGLGSVREGNLLRVAPLGVLEKELEAEIARQKQIADVLPTETRLIGVSYAEAGQMVDKARDLLSPRGKISVDARTNNLIVSDVAKNLQLIEDLVRNLDTQTSQVVIEARVVEANSNFTRQMGIQWGGSGFADSTHGNPTGLVFPYNIGIGGGADDSAAPVSGLVPGARTGSGTTGSPNFLVNMPAAAGLGTGSAIGLTMGSVAGAFNLNLRLSAMESQGQVRILSSPRITTMDNVEATISQGVSIPVSVVSAAGAQTQFVDAKLLLGVKPHVTNEGTISLDVHITRNEPDFVNTGARGDPSIQKKEAKTVMLVRDGDTAVIGGIYTRNTGLSNAKVPFFSDIPVLGWFFRNRKENDNRSEFLVFITPRIVNRARALGQ